MDIVRIPNKDDYWSRKALYPDLPYFIEMGMSRNSGSTFILIWV